MANPSLDERNKDKAKQCQSTFYLTQLLHLDFSPECR